MSKTERPPGRDAERRRGAAAMRRVTDYLVHDFGGGHALEIRVVINFQKCGTFLFLGFLMWYYGNDSAAAWVYLAMQGSYGLAWFIKDLAFPDPAWQARITIGGGINAFLVVLGWYWVFGWLLISGASTPDYPLPEGAWFALCVSLCLLGTVIMIAADAQKYHAARTPGFDHRRHVPLCAPPELPGRDGDLCAVSR
jgi:hypothetical protein